MERFIIKGGYVWELDMYSTILSRKYSYHMVVGKARYVRVRKEEKR